MNYEDKIKELGFTLPEAPSAVGLYEPAVQSGNLLFVSGVLPMVDGKLIYKGKLGSQNFIAQGEECAKTALLNALAIVKARLGSLDKVARIVKLVAYVASDPRFYGQSDVVNGASRILNDVFGDAGRHARVAIGVATLPLNSPLELELTVEVRD